MVSVFWFEAVWPIPSHEHVFGQGKRQCGPSHIPEVFFPTCEKALYCFFCFSIFRVLQFFLFLLTKVIPAPLIAFGRVAWAVLIFIKIEQPTLFELGGGFTCVFQPPSRRIFLYDSWSSPLPFFPVIVHYNPVSSRRLGCSELHISPPAETF